MDKLTNKDGATVAFIALGCPKNTIDSEKMLARLAQAGFVVTAETDNADVVVINTCSFIAPARQEAMQAINCALERKRSGAVRKVIVTGCLPQRDGAELLRQARGVDAVVGLAYRDDIARIVTRTLAATAPAAYLDYHQTTVTDDRARLLITPGHWAYLRISEGCDHRCSFCTIPAIRGRFRSKPEQLILAEADELARAGVVELNIVAQDSSYYGRDLKIKDGLAKLLRLLEQVPQLRWIRVMYLYPTGVSSNLLEVFSSSEKIVHYVDLPVQHISDKILKAMRRPDTKESICRLIETFRHTMPDVILRTTVIVGFPGETDQQFEELLDFINWARFDALGCFKYYAEPGTPAANMPDQVPEQVKEERLEQVMLTQQQIAFAKNREKLGSVLRCLVDSVDSDGRAQGRYYGQAPEIDSVCLIENCSAGPGRFIDVEVVGSKDYDLVVRQI